MISISRTLLIKLLSFSLHTLRLLSICTPVLVLCNAPAFAQQVPIDTLNKYGLYDADRLPAAFHAERRKLVLDSMGSGSVALFMSAPKKNRANDVDYEYHQDPNFYYLTGHLEPGSALILMKEEQRLSRMGETHSSATREILFVQERNPQLETWSGKRLGIEGSEQVLDFTHVYPIDSLEEVLASLLLQPNALQGRQTLYYTPVYDPHYQDPVLDQRFALHDEMDSLLHVKYPGIIRHTLTKVLNGLRMIKTREELALLRKAISITNEAHNEIMRQVKPGWYEYEIQALGEYVFQKNGSEYTGYPCIVGSGENSVILHYNTNRRKTEEGDVVEMDIGAEYHGYTADVTRSYPVNGRFTKEQRILYDLVLEAQDSGIRECIIGNDFRAAHRTAVSVISRGLVALGIIKSPDEYRKYFMHGTSHYIGLDVHDPNAGGPLPANSVITVEPGIYIKEGSDCDPKWWNIGIRIEDDILVTPNGPVNLSAGSPRTAEAVEALMREGKAMR
jgi:Xaa-Pro aminopeptidase